MALKVSEVAAAASFSRSSNDGQLADSQSRVFRIVLSQPGEAVDIQTVCNVKIGDEHPFSSGLFCVSFDARFEGETRSVISATFNYQTTAAQAPDQPDPKSQPPELRPANWTISSTTYDKPVQAWRQLQAIEPPAGNVLLGIPAAWGDPKPAANGVGDMYDNVATLDGMATITVRQFEEESKADLTDWSGHINDQRVDIGGLRAYPHTLMFRGLRQEPHIESWGGVNRRGFMVTFELVYKPNRTLIHLPGGPGGGADGAGGLQDVYIGWDIAVPQTGFNVRAFNPAAPAANQDPFGQPLRHENGRIPDGALALPARINVDDKVRGMVRVFEHEGGGASQLPCAQPIALNDNGTPRLVHVNNNENELAHPPIVYAYQVLDSFDLIAKLGLRIE